MSQVGRISGPLLEENLLRLGQVRTSQENLAFRNDLNTTQLLYIDVQQGRISINNANPSHELHVTGTTKTTDLIVDDEANIDGRWTIETNNLTLNVGDIQLKASVAVVLSNLETPDFFASDNYITTKDNNDLNLVPNGTGTVEVLSNLLVDGNIYTPGNITFEGNITFGDAQQIGNDTVDFNTDVNSDIIPDQNDTFALGSNDKRWNNLYTNLVNGQGVSTATIFAGANDYNLVVGNIFYVSETGNDANKGDHILSPFNSIKRACEAADASVQGPVIIHVFPGGYEEECPIVVPPNVTIIGHDMRNTIVRPESAYQSEDIFHLSGDTTISNLTIKDFYYDSINNTGYAFRFAPNTVTTARSPYIQDVTVITQGSTTTAEDPRGFASGDAGKGAWIDGAEMNASSFDASMLFHSCTFITPGVDAITMTNGVRVEWLNSFTYFADRGLYAVNGATGRVTQDGSTINYGAEVRSIGSANVYGNYGAVADGADTLMYLIQHNMAYIGVGKYSDNDKSRIIQANEIVELNNGVIHYTTTDHTGSFRVGDNFFVDFETGSTTINIDDLTANALNGLIITTGPFDTKIDGAFIEVGNFNIVNNLIETVDGEINIEAATNEINLNSNTSVSGNLDITGNLTFDGSLNLLGNQPTDTLTLNVDIDQNFNPHENLQFTLGNSQKEWKNTWLSSANIGDIRIFDNVITTDVSNADLELRANGSGKVYIPSNNVSITNALTVSGVTDLQSVNITGTLNQTGNFSLQVPDFNIDGNLTVGQNLNVGANAQFEEILFANNIITTTTSDTDLELRANGTGNILVPNNNVTVTNSFEVKGSTFTGDIDNSQQVEAVTFTNGDIEFTQNQIYTTLSNSDLEFRATTGKIINITDSTTFNQDLTVNLDTTLQSTSITGSLLHTGDYTQTGNYTIGGELTVDNVYVEDNFITTTSGDLILEATGNVIIDTNNVLVENSTLTSSLTVDGSTTLQPTYITGTLNHTGNNIKTVGNLNLLGELTVDNVYIEDNFITTTSGNLTLGATGDINVDTNNVEIAQDLTVSGATNLQLLSITGTLTHVGDTTQTGNYTQTGNLTVSGQVSITDSPVRFEDIQVTGNVIETTQTNSNLDLRAAGIGSVIFVEDTRFGQDLSVRNVTVGNIVIAQDLNLNDIVIPPSIIQIDDNFISTKISNEDLDLRANGTGIVFVPSNDVTVENNVTVNGLATTKAVNITGLLDQTGNRTQTGDISVTGTLTATQNLTTDRDIRIADIEISRNTVKTLTGNTDLVLLAAGTGNVSLVSTVIEQDLSISTLNVQSISINDSVALENMVSSTDIDIFDNVITTTNSNSNLDLRANGTGFVRLQEFAIENNLLKTDLTDIAISTDILTINSTDSLELPKDNAAVQGEISFNTSNNLFEGYGTAQNYFGGVYSANARTRVTANNDNSINFFVNNVRVGGLINNLSDGSKELEIHGLQVDDISLQNNSIRTNVSNSNLELRTTGTGQLNLSQLSLKENTIKDNGNNLIIKSTGFGHTKFAGTGAVAFPYGTTNERPIESGDVAPQTGDTRWNTDTAVLETWDGNQYITAAGVATAISEQEYNDLLLEYTLIFG